jgi:hypothetical protein
MIISVDDADTILAHYGVKGMKWGIRRKSAGSSSDPLSATKNMSNDDLRKVIDRMRLEQQYSELAKNPKKEAGKKYATKMAQDSGNRLVGAVVGTVATIAVTMALGNHVARSEATKEVAKEAFKKQMGGGDK